MSTDKEQYEGWSNRETWAVALHLNKAQFMYNHWRIMLKRLRQGPSEKDDLNLTFEIDLKNWIEEMWKTYFSQPHEVTDNARQQLNDLRLMIKDVGSLWRVNWREIATSLIEEIS